MNETAKRELASISEDLYDIMDRLEELSEDYEDLALKLNLAINKLSEACDLIEE